MKNIIKKLEKRLNEIHCLAENIIDEVEGTTSHNEFQPNKPSQDFILEKAGKILDIALKDKSSKREKEDSILTITNCEHEGNQNAIVLQTSITRETGLLAIEQFDRDAIEITQEQALRLVAYILKNSDKIITTKEFYEG